MQEINITAIIIWIVQGLLVWAVWSFKKSHPSHKELTDVKTHCQDKIDTVEEKLEKELKEHTKEYEKIKRDVHGIAIKMESMPTGKEVSELLVKVTQVLVKIDVYTKQNEEFKQRVEQQLAEVK